MYQKSKLTVVKNTIIACEKSRVPFFSQNNSQKNSLRNKVDKDSQCYKK